MALSLTGAPPALFSRSAGAGGQKPALIVVVSTFRWLNVLGWGGAGAG